MAYPSFVENGDPTSPGYAAFISRRHQLSGIARATAWRCSTPTVGEPTTISAGVFPRSGMSASGWAMRCRIGPCPNDGLAIRGSVKLPTGDESALAGSGGYSASLWAETSGALPGSAGTRSWLYSASLGALAGEAPSGLPDLGNRFVAFGHLGVTWRPLEPSEPDGATRCPFLALRRIGCGGTCRSWRHDRPRRRVAAQRARVTLEIAVTEDDGLHRGAPDIGLHAAIRWRPVVPPASSQPARNRAMACL